MTLKPLPESAEALLGEKQSQNADHPKDLDTPETKFPIVLAAMRTAGLYPPKGANHPGTGSLQ